MPKKNIVHVVSFSGGRTSAYLVHLMEERRKKENLTVKYLFMDTGAEHPKTYDFIRNVVDHFGIDLVCLRTKFNPVLGKKNDYEVISLDDIRQDLKPFQEMTEKYGTPYNPGGAFCTRAMKTDIYEWYCNEHFGLKNYYSWLGIRIDEPKRLKPEGERLSKKQARWYKDLKYLADISDFEKEDVLNWWSKQSFDLQIPEHLGNCVFCIKKGINKVALAAKDEPLMAENFNTMLGNPKIRVVEKRKSPNEIMYRGKNSFESVIALFKDVSRDEIFNSLRNGKKNDSGNCSESCEIINGEEEIELPELKATKKSEKPKAKIGDLWRTPPEPFYSLNKEFEFVADMAASDENFLCELYFTEDDDSLSFDWAEYIEITPATPNGNKYVWLNCPYSNPMPWVKQSLLAQSKGLGVVMLLNADHSVGWFAEALKGVSEIRNVIADEKESGGYSSGRLAFLNGDGDPISGNNKPQFVLVFNPFKIGARVTSYITKNELYGK